MTKAELLQALAAFPDDIPVLVYDEFRFTDIIRIELTKAADEYQEEFADPLPETFVGIQ